MRRVPRATRVQAKVVNNDYFSLSANGGVARHLVLEILLHRPRFVARAVEIGRCFLCMASEVDVTGMCLICRSFLSDEEREAAQAYYDAPP